MGKRFSGQFSALIMFFCMTVSSALASPTGSLSSSNQSAHVSESSNKSTAESNGVNASSSNSTGFRHEDSENIGEDSRSVEASVLGKEIAEHKTGDGQKINDVIFNLISGYVGRLDDLTAMVSAAQEVFPSPVGQFTLAALAPRNEALVEIKKLLDPLKLVKVEKGAFRFTNIDSKAHVGIIHKDFYIPSETEITREQVLQIVGGAIRDLMMIGEATDLKKPMRGWSVEQWKKNYINPWNQKMAALWAVVYPGEPKPVMSIPVVLELMYAGTEPVPFEQQEIILVNGVAVRLTGVQRPQPGTSRKDLVEIARFIESNRSRAKGPSVGGAPEANPRGIRNLTGHLSKLTSTIDRSGGNNLGTHMVFGGAWHDDWTFCGPWINRSLDGEYSWSQYWDIGLLPVIGYQ